MKEYPDRQRNPDQPDPTITTIVGVCECGHSDYNHKGLESNVGGKKECMECMCPKYEYELTTTQRKYLDGRYEIRKQNASKQVHNEKSESFKTWRSYPSKTDSQDGKAESK